MEFIDAYERLLQSPNFLEWQKRHPSSYLAHFFAELSTQLMPLNWEIGFYNAERDLITTFTVNESISMQPEAQVFKEKNTVEKLNLGEIKLSAEDALHHAREHQLGRYPGHTLLGGLIILQTLDLGALWNITFMTHTSCGLNIKVDASSGTITAAGLITFQDIAKQ